MRNFHHGLLLAALVLGACTSPPTPAPPVLQGQAPARQIEVGPAPGAMAPTFNFLYVANQGGTTLSVIDPRADAVVKAVDMPGGTPGVLKSFRAGRYVLAADTKQNQLLVLDSLKDHQVMQTVAVGGVPQNLAIGLDDRTVAVTLENQAKVLLLTFEADRTRPPARRELSLGQAAGSVVMDFDGSWALAANPQENRVQLFGFPGDTPRPLPVAAGPLALGAEFVEDNPRAFMALIADSTASTLSLFPLAGGEPTTLSNLGTTPRAIALDPRRTRAYVAMAGSKEIAVVDYKAGTLVTRLPLPAVPARIDLADPLATSPYRVLHGEGGYQELWVSYEGSPTISVFEGENLDPVGAVTTGDGPHSLLFRGDKAYVANQQAGTVSVVDRRTLTH